MNPKIAPPQSLKFKLYLFSSLFAALFYGQFYAHPLGAETYQQKGLQQIVGRNDGVIIADPEGKIIFEKNSNKKLIPASTLKILTSLAALHYLGSDYRFPTDFYYDDNTDLWVKGYGDPLLVSEVLADISATLSKKFRLVGDLFLDDSFFLHPVIIPGVNSSFQPYDAPNGALCANFNTINFKRTQTGDYISAEPQTPLLPFVIQRIKTSSLDSERIILSHENRAGTYYTGHLLRFFLNNNGVQTTGKIKIGAVRSKKVPLILKHYSPFSMAQIIARLLEYSNNFIANQILTALGATLYDPPGTLDKGVQAVSAYLKTELGITDISFVEGSGISRKNRISAKGMLKILEKFEPYHYLMRNEGAEFYKTGSLDGVSARAGFIGNKKGELYRFVRFSNTPGKSSDPVIQKFRALVSSLPG